MATTADFLNKLVEQKNDLATRLVEKGIEASTDETLETLVPKVSNIESGGVSADPYELARQMVDKTIVEYIDDKVTKLADGAFAYCSKLTKLHAPNATELGKWALRDCALLEDLDISNVEKIGGYAFSGTKLITKFYSDKCKELGANPFGNNDNMVGYSSYIEKAIFTVLETIVAYSFGGGTAGQKPVRLKYVDCGSALATIPSKAFYNSHAEVIILRKSDGICTLSAVDAFTNSYIVSGKGYIYVPQALLEEYKNATNWATYADQIVAIEGSPYEDVNWFEEEVAA